MTSYQITNYQLKICDKILNYLHKKSKAILRLTIEYNKESILENHLSFCLKCLRSCLNLTLSICYASFFTTLRYKNPHLATAKLRFLRLDWQKNGR